MLSLPVGVFAVTVGLRLFHLRTSYDVFLDESIYSRISAGAAADGRLVFGNYPFYLHGPLSFYLQAFVIRVFGIGGTAIEVIDRLRVFNVLVAGGVAVLVYAIVRAISRPRWGLLAAALFAFDPFIISFDSRLFLETLATFWVLLGFYLLLPLAVEPGHGGGHERSAAAQRARHRGRLRLRPCVAHQGDLGAAVHAAVAPVHRPRRPVAARDRRHVARDRAGDLFALSPDRSAHGRELPVLVPEVRRDRADARHHPGDRVQPSRSAITAFAGDGQPRYVRDDLCADRAGGLRRRLALP